MTWLLSSRIGRALSALVVAALAFVGVYITGRAKGADNARDKAREQDYARADDIRRRARDADGLHDTDDGYRD